jgi:hypothetical protein
MKMTKAAQRLHGNPRLKERVHDPYQAARKLVERTRCPDCGAVYRNGRWTWPKLEVEWVRKELCPACRRTRDRYPAGELLLSGAFVAAHADEIMNQIRRIEAAERLAHPLNRILDIERDDEEIRVTTTDIHLPHRLGHALKDAWSGSLSTHFDREGHFSRVLWQRGA